MITNLVLIQTSELGDKTGVRIFAGYGVSFRNERVLAYHTEHDKTKCCDAELPNGSVRRYDGCVRTPHGEDFLLLVHL